MRLGAPLLLGPLASVAVKLPPFLLENFRLRNRHHLAKHAVEVLELVVRVAHGLQFLGRLRDRLFALHSSTRFLLRYLRSGFTTPPSYALLVKRTDFFNPAEE